MHHDVLTFGTDAFRATQPTILESTKKNKGIESTLNDRSLIDQYCLPEESRPVPKLGPVEIGYKSAT